MKQIFKNISQQDISKNLELENTGLIEMQFKIFSSNLLFLLTATTKTFFCIEWV